MNGMPSTLQGLPPCCPICGAVYRVEPADPAGAAPCTVCGHLVWYEWIEDGTDVVVRITNDQIAPGSVARLAKLIKSRSIKKLTFDCSRVHQVTSDTLAEFVSLRRHLLREKGEMVIRKLHPDLREVFRILRLDQVLPIED